ncbi:polysaccharide deacetylase family protein [Brevibacillus ginsengisoli]|uniref:polysaccharide deacetylase family protein n=1 Tax=Brevibacillus ginsengisoli TaxID=363854 RepID=UPI003CF73154
MMKPVALVLVTVALVVTSLCGSAIAQNADPLLAAKKGRKYYESRKEIVWEVPTKDKVIALTFDDGPDPHYTPQLAALLKQYNAKATFFVVGSRVKKFPNIVRALSKDGHEIGNHTQNHPDLRRISSIKLEEEISKANQTIRTVTGNTPSLFRPPGGYYSESLVHVAKKMDNLVIMWSWHQDTRDWSNPGVKKIVNKVLTNARNGDIVLFHDNGGRQTVEAIKKILPELHQKGYQFVTVSDLLKRNQK